ncbi:apolipoprotein N-acyltransferase [Treponema pectinovorum]|uniref:apolipoprotein N-acyltransferase n=1 Tax=Treponema pectinovorum TaxID=164 RepID=UPI003D89E111
MFCFLQVFCSLFSATLLSLSIPNELYKLGCPVLALFSLVPLYIAISRSKSYKGAFWLCFLHGGFTHLVSSFWLKNFQGLAAFTLGASLVGTAFIEAFVGLFLYFPYSNQKNRENFSSSLKIFYFAAVYVIYEWCKSTGFLAYPWGTLSMTAFKWPVMMQIADITSQYGVSFLFAYFSAFVAQSVIIYATRFRNFTFKKDRANLKLSFFALASLFLLNFSYGVFQYTKERKPLKMINTIMVQQNMDTYRSNELEAIEVSQNLTEKGIEIFENQGEKADLVVWSEGVLNKYWPYSKIYYQKFPEDKPLLAFIKEKNLPFIIGGALTIDRDLHKYSNAAILLTKDGDFAGAYSKLHLVPFAESIPFVEYESVRKFIKKIAGFSYGWTQGNKNTVFEIPVKSQEEDFSGTELISLVERKNQQSQKKQSSVIVSTPICFDDAYSHVFRGLFLAGTELFMNITNDSWSKTQSAEYQHFAVSAYRAIEFRTTFARCTNSGFTVVLNPAGKIIDSIPLFEEEVLSTKIPIYERKLTLACLLGDWLPYTLMIFIAYVILKDSLKKLKFFFERILLQS